MYVHIGAVMSTERCFRDTHFCYGPCYLLTCYVVLAFASYAIFREFCLIDKNDQKSFQ